MVLIKEETCHLLGSTMNEGIMSSIRFGRRGLNAFMDKQTSKEAGGSRLQEGRKISVISEDLTPAKTCGAHSGS